MSNLPDTLAELSLLINTYKNVCLIRDLSEGETKIVSLVESKFVSLLKND